jgi:flagellar biosynthesis chaperone FliJ
MTVLTFKEFVKNPLSAIMFLMIIAIGYLYVDSKLNYNRQIEELKITVNEQGIKIERLTEQLRKSDSTLSAATSKLQVLQELGKIK